MRRRHWSTPAEPGDPYVLGLDVSPTDPNNIIAGVEYGATLRSADGGKTWSQASEGDEPRLPFAHVSRHRWQLGVSGGRRLACCSQPRRRQDLAPAAPGAGLEFLCDGVRR